MKLYKLLLTLLFTTIVSANSIPLGFVNLKTIIPNVVIELRYYTDENFVAKAIDGYEADVCYLSTPAAHALKSAQEELVEFGLGLKVFDAYRPQQAVDHFVKWAEDINDTKVKAKYYPNVKKSELFEKGYIAARSGHSRGSTVDLILIDLVSKKELDMGSGFDLFDPISWPTSMEVTPQQRANRLLLRSIMLRHGFKPLKEEWWHFTFKDEPYPKRYFDFKVR